MGPVFRCGTGKCYVDFSRALVGVVARSWVGEGLDFEVDAGDLGGAPVILVAGAGAEFCKADVAGLAELDSRGNEDAVDIDAGLPLKFEEHVDDAGVGGPAAENPASAAEDGPGEGCDEARWLDLRDGFHLQNPGCVLSIGLVSLRHCKPHFQFYRGWRRRA